MRWVNVVEDGLGVFTSEWSAGDGVTADIKVKLLIDNL